MTDKEKARESWWNDTNCSGGMSTEKIYECGFLAGLKAGKLKWHDLRKNTEDLPKGDVHRTILLKDRYGNIYTGAFYPKDEYHKENCFSVECLEYGFQGNNFVAFEQIAKWSEFPKEE